MVDRCCRTSGYVLNFEHNNIIITEVGRSVIHCENINHLTVKRSAIITQKNHICHVDNESMLSEMHHFSSHQSN